MCGGGIGIVAVTLIHILPFICYLNATIFFPPSVDYCECCCCCLFVLFVGMRVWVNVFTFDRIISNKLVLYALHYTHSFENTCGWEWRWATGFSENAIELPHKDTEWVLKV